MASLAFDSSNVALPTPESSSPSARSGQARRIVEPLDGHHHGRLEYRGQTGAVSSSPPMEDYTSRGVGSVDPNLPTTMVADDLMSPARVGRIASLGKRRRERDTEELVAPQPLHIRPCTESTHATTLLLQPISVVQRSQLPLSFLDTSTPTFCRPSDRLFSGYIAVLESGKNVQASPQILIVTLGNEATLHAVERVKPRIYTLCRLYSWINIGHIVDGLGSAAKNVIPVPTPNANSTSWWDSAAVKPCASNHPFSAKRSRLSMTSASRMLPPTREAQRLAAADSALGLPLPLTSDHSIAVPHVDGPQSNDEIFEALVRQYLDALYVSKTSLAFFVKGPLSRARNGVVMHPGTSVGVLVQQLQAMLLPMAAMDKKYRDKLPELIKTFPPHALSDNEGSAVKSSRKRKAKKVPKLSRDGLYSIEEEFSKKWWLNNESANARARNDETLEQLTRRRIGDLRRRETLAQIALILEILALEASSEYKALDTQALETTETQATATEGMTQSTSTKRRKKPIDLHLHLDLLLDKLSIWQSIEQDTNSTQADKKGEQKLDIDEKIHEQDLLVGFCVDVVVPFYKFRIPKQAALVNKKLGGPVARAPAEVESGSLKIGQDKSGDRGARRPLQKTLSDTNALTRSRQPSLIRSVTDSQGMPRLKRESSDVSLLDIPLARPAHRDSTSQLRHLKSRQVDMQAISVATEAKLKQKAKIDADLKAAINTLKKPNRGQAVRELVDAADQRSLGSASMRKKTMGPVRKVLQTIRGVQVSATPKHNRAYDALHATRGDHDEMMDPQPPFPGEFRIPSSGYRLPVVDAIGVTPARSRPRSTNHSAVTDTPRHVPSSEARFEDSFERSRPLNSIGDTPANVFASGPSSFKAFVLSKMSETTVPGTPSKSRQRLESTFKPPQKPAMALAIPDSTSNATADDTEVDVQATPFGQTVAIQQQADEEAGTSIYDALGWNDYDDDLA